MAKKNGPFKKIFGTLKQLAPTVAAGLGGPLGGIAAGVLRSKLGVSADTPDGGLVAAVQNAFADPAELAKIREAEAELQKMELEQGISFAELEVADRASARELAKATSIVPQVALSALFIVGYFVIVGLFFSDQIAVPMGEAFYLLVGVLTAAVPQILGFWFGSSHGSKQKTAALANEDHD